MAVFACQFSLPAFGDTTSSQDVTQKQAAATNEADPQPATKAGDSQPATKAGDSQLTTKAADPQPAAKAGDPLSGTKEGAPHSTTTAKDSPATTKLPEGQPATSPTKLPTSEIPEKQPESATAPGTVNADSDPTKSQSPPALASNEPPEWHRIVMRLSGSMCIACLKDLEEHLRKLAGVDRVKVERAPPSFTSSVSPDVTNWAQGVVVYDMKRLPYEYLREEIRKNGYHPYHLVDKELMREPTDRDLKF